MSLSPGIRVLAGWFQAMSTRTAGFAVVNLAELRPSIQVSYLIMMYISVFPVTMSVRRTNVFEERSLGIWGHSNANADKPQSYVGSHLRRQLGFDLWYTFSGLFIIAIADGKRLEDTQEDVSPACLENGGFLPQVYESDDSRHLLHSHSSSKSCLRTVRLVCHSGTLGHDFAIWRVYCRQQAGNHRYAGERSSSRTSVQVGSRHVVTG